MEHLIEDPHLSVTKDTNVFGTKVLAGTKITIVSKQGDFNGLKMRIPPPEFEALMLFSAIDSAAKSEVLKKLVTVNRSKDDGVLEVSDTDTDKNNFFASCQNAMTAVAFSISALESWANKSIAVFGQKNGSPTTLKLERPNKQPKEIRSDKVASDSGIPIKAKLFQIIPQVLSITPLKQHSTMREKIGSLIDERNVVMHMQPNLKLKDTDGNRASYAIKLFKTNALLTPELVIQFLEFNYSKANMEMPQWIEIAKEQVKSLKNKIK